MEINGTLSSNRRTRSRHSSSPVDFAVFDLAHNNNSQHWWRTTEDAGPVILSGEYRSCLGLVGCGLED